jgi:hypothetical protein
VLLIALVGRACVLAFTSGVQSFALLVCRSSKIRCIGCLKLDNRAIFSLLFLSPYPHAAAT